SSWVMKKSPCDAICLRFRARRITDNLRARNVNIIARDFIFLGAFGQAKIRRDGSLSHAGMNRIRSQGLVSARRADTPSDPGDVVRVATAVSSHRRFTFRARTASFDSAGAKRKRGIASPLLRIEESGTMRLGLWLVRSTSMDPWL